MPATSAVHIARAGDYDAPLADILQKQYEHFRAAVPVAGKRVVLKPNLVEYHRDKVINTDPRFVSAVIELFKREGAAEIVVAEGPGHWRNVQFLVNESGLGDVLRAHGVRFVDLNHDEPVKVTNLGRCTGLEHLYLSRTVLSAEVFVSLPKLKTHHWAGATLSLKNLFGTLPGICYGWPKNELHWRGIPNSIVDIALTHTPHLAIVDGIVGMEGDGPLNGTAKPVGALVMGVGPGGGGRDLLPADGAAAGAAADADARGGEATREPTGGIDPPARRADRGASPTVRAAAEDREAASSRAGSLRRSGRVFEARRDATTSQPADRPPRPRKRRAVARGDPGQTCPRRSRGRPDVRIDGRVSRRQSQVRGGGVVLGLGVGLGLRLVDVRERLAGEKDLDSG